MKTLLGVRLYFTVYVTRKTEFTSSYRDGALVEPSYGNLNRLHGKWFRNAGFHQSAQAFPLSTFTCFELVQ